MGDGNIGNQYKTQIKNVLYANALKHNLLSISQLGYKNCCLISEAMSSKVVHIGKMIGNIHMLNIEHASFHELRYLVSKIDDSWLWHCRATNINVHHLNHLVIKDLVTCIPKLKFEKNKLCKACQKGKQVKNSFQSKNVVSILKPLQLLQIDLFAFSRTEYLLALDSGFYVIA